MKKFTRLAVFASLASLAFPLSAANAGTILETAANSGTNDGDYILHADNIIGASFSVDATTNITSIGAEFQGISGTIFGAIVPLSSLTDVPPAGSSHDLASIALANVVFSVPDGFGDVTAPLSVSLDAGTYAVIFGSGQFGASGYAGLGDSNTPISGNYPMFQSIFSDDFDKISDSGIRIFVNGDAVAGAVPEPASWALMIGGIGMAGAAMRRQRRVTGTVTFA